MTVMKAIFELDETDGANKEIDLLSTKKSNNKNAVEIGKRKLICIITLVLIVLLLVWTGYSLHNILSKKAVERKRVRETNDRIHAINRYSHPDCGIIRCNSKTSLFF